MSLMTKLCISVSAAIFGVVPFIVQAQVISFDVVKTQSALEGRSFGNVSAYVRITGRAPIAIASTDLDNAIIANIAQAARDAKGKVGATAHVVLIRPAEPHHAYGTLSTSPIAD
jgi:hypothetical protein